MLKCWSPAVRNKWPQVVRSELPAELGAGLHLAEGVWGGAGAEEELAEEEAM